MAEAPNSMQLPSGYDEDFVYEVEDDCLCLICHLPLKEPALTRCGHRFCKVCLEEHLKRQEAQNQPYTCPADREGLDRDRDVFPDNATGRKILSMVIKCPSDGCSWTGELRNKEAHLDACPFKIVTCTNENCHVTIKRKDLEQHVTNTCDWKILKCEYCKEPLPERCLKDHLENCSKFPLPCPNDCGDSVLREMIPNHIGNVCPLSLVSCPYEEMGCIEKFQRKNVDSHLQSAMREHLDLACVKLNNTQVQLRNTQETTRKLEEKFETLQRQLAKKVDTDKEGGNKRFIWKINCQSSPLISGGEVMEEKESSNAFYTGCHGYKLKVKLSNYYDELFHNWHLKIAVVLMKGEYDDILPWPFSKKITVTLIDQNEDLKERKNITKYLSPSEHVREQIFSGRPTPDHYWELHGEILRFSSYGELQTRRYFANHALFIQVDVEPDD